MGLFDKKISEPVLSVVQAMKDDKFEFSTKDGVWTLKLKDYDMKLQFWAGRMMAGGWCTEDEQKLLYETARCCFNRYVLTTNNNTRAQWGDVLKGK